VWPCIVTNFFIIKPTRCTDLTNLFWHETLNIPLLRLQWINSWWWTEELPETCRDSCQNKCVKSVHLVGFIIKKLHSILTQVWPLKVCKTVLYFFFFFFRDHTQTNHTRWDSSGLWIGPPKRPPPDNAQYSQETNFHATRGIRTRKTSKQAAVDRAVFVILGY
jgi:hypothetical protein